MSHLVVRKDDKGTFRIYNKNTKQMEGAPMSDKKTAQKVTKAKDIQEDVAMKK